MLPFLRKLLRRLDLIDPVPRASPTAPSFSFTCKCCGGTHSGLPDVTLIRPDALLPLDAVARAACFEASDGCMIPAGLAGPIDRYFLRGTMHFRLVGEGAAMQELFGFGLWAEVAQEPFEGVMNGEAGPPLSPFSGRIASRLPGVESSIDLPVRIERAESRLRPVLFVLDENHELARLRQDGITLERAMSTFHAAGF